METKHDTVLLTEAVAGLALAHSDVVVDATIGGAGHFSLLLEALGADGVLIGIDADNDAIVRAQHAEKGAQATVHLVEGNFRDMKEIVQRLSITEVDKVLFDLGWSAFHLSAGRGFSFRVEEPLLMTYGEPVAGSTAADMVNTATEEALADILYTYGEERFARSIARAIVERRSHARILTTTNLVDTVLAGTPAWYHHRRIHPATKTFQALRIAVNDELGALRAGLEAAMALLSERGRIAVISFHSIEDRIVKTYLRDAAHSGLGTLITKKPISPSFAEVQANPRARSAKLRIFEKGSLTSSVTPQYHSLSYAS